MKHKHGFALQFLYITIGDLGKSQYQMGLMSTNDPVDHRAIKRIFRKWVKTNLGRSLHPIEMRLILKKVILHNMPRTYVRSRSTIDGEAVAFGKAGNPN
jgi:hypothetical protein